MSNLGKAVALMLAAACVLTLASCMLFGSSEPRYEIVGNWRRTIGNTTITFYMKDDGTYNYSNNYNGKLDAGEYTVDWRKHVIHTIHKMNHSLDEDLSFRFQGPEILEIDDYAYMRM